jgi:hypothetical protein
MMKKLIVFVVFIFAFTASNAQTLNCKKFRNGTFQMKYNKGNIAIIKRQGNVQDEFVNGAKIPTLSFIVKWIDDCTYTLTPDLVTRKKNPDMPKDATMVVKITKTTSNSYFTTSYLNADKKTIFNSELVLVK